MMPSGWTIGAELELADVERDRPLPGRSTWDRKDYTIVNSNGVANDPTGRLWRFGAEINTEPSDSIDGQLETILAALAACRPEPAANYRCNLHIHVRVPGLDQDVPTLRRLFRYVFETAPAAFDLVDPMPPLPRLDGPERDGAKRRWARREVSHHAMLSKDRMLLVLAAATPSEMRAAHAAVDRLGRPQYQLAARCGINLRALWETPGATIEFRHFCMSLDAEELRNALRWCVVYLRSGLGDQAQPSELLWPGARFPMQPLYDHWLETRYRASSRRYHSEDAVRAVLARWAQEGSLEGPRSLHREPVAQPVTGTLFD